MLTLVAVKPIKLPLLLPEYMKGWELLLVRQVHRPIHAKFTQWVTRILNERMKDCVELRSVHASAAALNELLIPAKDIRELLMAAGRLIMPHNTYQADIRIPVSMSMFDTREPYIDCHLQYKIVPEDIGHVLIPMMLPTLTMNSQIGQQLIPSVQLAQDWISLRYVFKELCDMNDDRRMLGGVFPWLRDLLLDVQIPHDERVMKRMFSAWEIKDKKAQGMIKDTFAAVLEPAQNVPAMSAMVKQVALSGTKLMSQYRLLRANLDQVVSEAILTPIVQDDLISNKLRNAMIDTKKYHTATKGPAWLRNV